jgi:hypothetical protein
MDELSMGTSLSVLVVVMRDEQSELRGVEAPVWEP